MPSVLAYGFGLRACMKSILSKHVPKYWSILDRFLTFLGWSRNRPGIIPESSGGHFGTIPAPLGTIFRPLGPIFPPFSRVGFSPYFTPYSLLKADSSDRCCPLWPSAVVIRCGQEWIHRGLDWPEMVSQRAGLARNGFSESWID